MIDTRCTQATDFFPFVGSFSPAGEKEPTKEEKYHPQARNTFV
jgi:hypothetical protein